MTKDFADFLESLNREGVAYVVIIRMKSATADAVKDVPDVQRLEALRKLRNN